MGTVARALEMQICMMQTMLLTGTAMQAQALTAAGAAAGAALRLGLVVPGVSRLGRSSRKIGAWVTASSRKMGRSRDRTRTRRRTQCRLPVKLYTWVDCPLAGGGV
jgi:hypothetical protein